MIKVENFFSDRVKNNNCSFSSASGIIIKNEQKQRTSMKRTKLNNSQITNSRYNRCAFTGSSFSSCSFEKSNIEYSDFHNCKFINSDFDDCGNLNGNNFDNSYWSNVTFKKTDFKNCGLSGMKIVNCKFIDSNIYSCTLEDTVFDSCLFINSDLSSINLDYSKFINCDFESSIMPFSQLPYILGLKDLLENKGIKITTDDKQITCIEYKENILSWIGWYQQHNEYFATANLYIALNEKKEAFFSLENGIKLALLNQDFRDIRHLCILLSNSSCFDTANANLIYNLIANEAEKQDFSNDIFIRPCQLDEIRDILLNASFEKTKLKIHVETDISSKDTEGMKNVFETISNIIDQYDVSSHSIEIRHNSPFSFLAQSVQSYNNTLEIAANIVTIFGACGIVANIIDFIGKKRGVKHLAAKKERKNDLKIKSITITINKY